MNYYLVVEEECERKLYPKWINYLNSKFRIVYDIADVSENSIYIISGSGYPGYFEVIEDAAKDVCENGVFDKLLIAMDSEDMSFDEKTTEIIEFMDDLSLQVDYELIVQHFCIETWALGNRTLFKRRPENPELNEYIQLFSVLENDPELLPSLSKKGLNRAQFAKKYLRLLLRERFRNLAYKEADPKVLMHKKYFKQILERYNSTGHIRSFGGFISVFSE